MEILRANDLCFTCGTFAGGFGKFTQQNGLQIGVNQKSFGIVMGCSPFLATSLVCPSTYYTALLKLLNLTDRKNRNKLTPHSSLRHLLQSLI
jgi:hypothetical protein